MPKDIREIIRDAQINSKELKENHKQRFEQRLQKLHKPKKNYFFLKIAASLVVLISVGYFSFFNKPVDIEQQVVEPKITNLSSVSPEMQKIENYYLTAINYEIAGLEETPENEKILEDYLDKIGKLDADYKRLNKELSENGINEKIVNNMITNLQLRLQLLLQLKDQLSELRTSKALKNENNTI
ncbi:MAG: hypothetical protein L3J20_12250 [Flavobacteriaceae bacterium]|nr:hypothetical protein [Flavobacteriaceae bacterium]